jgi:hypothetical protein
MKLSTISGVAAMLLAYLSMPSIGYPAGPPDNSSPRESDYRIAAEWWRELPKKWTPLGWKNHLFRYNVLFNGALVAEPNMNRRTERFAGQGMLLWPSLANPVDDGSIKQGWRTDCEVPVLWTDWTASAYSNARSSGVAIRQEVFAHIPGGQDVNTGAEPLFAWMRVSIPPRKSQGSESSTFAFAYKIYGPQIGRSMVSSANLRYAWQKYPRSLSYRSGENETSPGMLLEPEGKVRLAVASQKGCEIEFHSSETESALGIRIDMQQANCLEILIPMIPAPRAVVEKELMLGYEKALAESDAYWREKPATAATIDVPEEPITRAIRSYLKMAEIVAETDPGTGDCSALTGAWTYADVWATPNSMMTALLLDPLGYHAPAERYLAVFKKYQGTTVPPGKAYKAHPGYLGTPKEYQAINWLSDNGALLWAFSQHALLSADGHFIEEYTPTIIKSCEWIRDARRMTGHGGIEGILPGAVATDEGREVQSIWNDGWNYKGLTAAVRLLKKIQHPRAAEFEAEAQDYRAQFVRAFVETSKKIPAWRDSLGKSHSMAPRNLSGDKDFGIHHAFYLDTGPLFLVFAGLMDADEEPITSNRAWFREGPPRRTYQDVGNCWQTPSLHREMSSCEPCYSWVCFHSWKLADRPRFLEGMYSLLAGASSRQTFTVCETRGGHTGLIPCLPSVWLARLSVIDDQIQEGELHLLRLAPLVWLRTDKEACFHNMPTEFGVVGLKVKLGSDGRELLVNFDPKFKTVPRRILLHIPPEKELKAVILNGKPLPWDGKQRILEIATAR